MPLRLIEQLLADPAPAFACRAMGDDSRTEAYLAPLAHFANAPAGPQLLARIPRVPGSEEVAWVYAAFDGVLLYTTDTQDAMTGVELFPIEQWQARTASMVGSWIDGGYQDQEMPYGRDDFIALAHSRGASSHMHWVVRGPRAGSIYWWAWTMPPEKNTPPVATHFSDFIRLLYERPAHFFNEVLLGYTRFYDGTGNEWIPNRYIPDRNHPSVGR
ncbi:MAG: hypothetical protein ACTHM6_18485 [Tepidisphaeraceae bacterium]